VKNVNPVSGSICDSAVIQILGKEKRSKLGRVRQISAMTVPYLRLQDESNKLLAVDPVKLSKYGQG
jgi:hypothetical protein